MIVVKVGGSLYDSPALGPALREFVVSLAPAEVLLVPGGGAVADAVRALDRTHALGEEAAHWVALRSLSVTALFLERLTEEPLPLAPSPKKGGGEKDNPPPSPLPAGRGSSAIPLSELDARIDAEDALLPLPAGRGLGGGSSSARERGPRVLDPFAFALEDEVRPGALPHTWHVTTDSIAARAAIVFRAERLVLLKSVTVPPGTSWSEAAANGWVDAHFPRIAELLACPVETVNFRAKLDTRT